MPVFDIHTYFGGSVIPGVAGSAESIRSDLSARGIERAIVFSSHALRLDPLAGNRVLRRIVDQDPGLYGCVITHTNRVESSIAVMREQMASPKFLGMAIAGNHPLEPVSRLLADEILNAYRRYGKPLFLYTPNEAAAAGALEIARAYPMFKVVLLGMGGSDWKAAITAARSSTNVYLETSGLLDRAKLPAALEALGSNRILFGSSSPHIDAAAALGLLEDSGISEEARRRILSENADRLFQMSAGG